MILAQWEEGGQDVLGEGVDLGTWHIFDLAHRRHQGVNGGVSHSGRRAGGQMMEVEGEDALQDDLG